MQNVVFDQEGDEEHHPRPEYSDCVRVPEEGQNKADEDEGNAMNLLNFADNGAQPVRRFYTHGDSR